MSLGHISQSEIPRNPYLGSADCVMHRLITTPENKVQPHLVVLLSQLLQLLAHVGQRGLQLGAGLLVPPAGLGLAVQGEAQGIHLEA